MADTIDTLFETVASGVYSSIKSSGNSVIKNEADWNKLWNPDGSGEVPDLPVIDFEKEMMLATFLGIKMTGGYSIKITDLKETNDSLEAYVTTTSPSFGSMNTMALTSPYHIIKTNLSDLEVKYNFN